MPSSASADAILANPFLLSRPQAFLLGYSGIYLALGLVAGAHCLRGAWRSAFGRNGVVIPTVSLPKLKLRNRTAGHHKDDAENPEDSPATPLHRPAFTTILGAGNDLERARNSVANTCGSGSRASRPLCVWISKILLCLTFATHAFALFLFLLPPAATLTGKRADAACAAKSQVMQTVFHATGAVKLITILLRTFRFLPKYNPKQLGVHPWARPFVAAISIVFVIGYFVVSALNVLTVTATLDVAPSGVKFCAPEIPAESFGLALIVMDLVGEILTCGIAMSFMVSLRRAYRAKKDASSASQMSSSSWVVLKGLLVSYLPRIVVQTVIIVTSAYFQFKSYETHTHDDNDGADSTHMYNPAVATFKPLSIITFQILLLLTVAYDDSFFRVAVRSRIQQVRTRSGSISSFAPPPTPRVVNPATCGPIAPQLPPNRVM
ncbi:hypothetical protein H9P43_004972 [Blastocladiella emersonii ATCC 22665]|nr:hypothetical protein H9P43_004972 [Blastocladiella emersonii ATCC 22665]